MKVSFTRKTSNNHGTYFPNQGRGRVVIYLKAREFMTSESVIYTLAHELGHHLSYKCRRKKFSEWNYITVGDIWWEEKRAWRYARFLLRSVGCTTWVGFNADAKRSLNCYAWYRGLLTFAPCHVQSLKKNPSAYEAMLKNGELQEGTYGPEPTLGFYIAYGGVHTRGFVDTGKRFPSMQEVPIGEALAKLKAAPQRRLPKNCFPKLVVQRLDVGNYVDIDDNHLVLTSWGRTVANEAMRGVV